MKIYKLKYTDKQEAIADLINKSVYIETEEGLEYGTGIQAIVEIGLIMLTEPTFDVDGNLLTEAVYADGYHYDVMSEQEIVFENEITVNNPKHMFAGYDNYNNKII
jgi:hypothetical protein